MTIRIYHALHGRLQRLGRPDDVIPTGNPPGIPTNVSSSAPSITSVTLTWAAPADSGSSPITEYSVARDGSSSTGGGEFSTTVSAATRAFTFNNLIASTTYHFTVAAVNSVGTGPIATLTYTTQPSPPPPPGDRFPGDPGVGNVYTGTEEGADGRDYLERQTGTRMLITHHYFTNQLDSAGTFWSRSQLQSDHDSGFQPFASFKLGGDGYAQSKAASILAGNYDSIFTAEAQWAKARGWPIFAWFYHEPEDNWNTGTGTITDTAAANYRAITRHIISIFKAQGATNVAWGGAIYQTPWSFSTGGQNKWGPWFKFWADWKGTISGSGGHCTAADFYTGSSKLIDLIGYDCYNPNIGGDTYHEFAGPINTALSRMAADGFTPPPFMVPEWGVRGAQGGGQLIGMPSDGWTGFYQRAFRYMRDNKGVGFMVYTVGGDSFISGPDGAARLAGLKAALNTETSYLVSSLPS